MLLLQRKPILRFRHHWKTRLVGLPARIKEACPRGSFIQPIFATNSRRLRSIAERMSRRRPAGSEQVCLELPGDRQPTRAGSAEVLCPAMSAKVLAVRGLFARNRAGVCVVENLLRPCWTQDTHQSATLWNASTAMRPCPLLGQEIHEPRKSEPATSSTISRIGVFVGS